MKDPLRVAVVVAVALVALTACSGADSGGAQNAAARFAQAVRDGNGKQACALLSPSAVDEIENSESKPCDQAILDEDLPTATTVTSSVVYGQQARAVTAKDTLFLSHFASGWKVIAAGCERQPDDKPYQCSVSGG